MDVEAPPPAETPAAAPAAHEEGSVAVGAVGVPAAVPASAPAPAAATLAALVEQVDEESAANSLFSELLLKVAQVVRLVEGERYGTFSDAEWILITSLGEYFRNGMLPLEAGSSLRLFLAKLLNRAPTAISTKFQYEEMELGSTSFEPQDVDLTKAVRTFQDQVKAFVASQRGRPSSPLPGRVLPVVDTARAGCRNSSTPIKHTDLPPLETIRKQGNPSYGSVINFDRRTSKEKKNDMAKWCVMCGKNEGTGDGCVTIPSNNKDVCNTCDSTFWKHNASGAYFKWCKGKKNFQEIHAFADNLKASKCDEERSRSSSPRAVPAPAATGGTAPGAAAKQRAKRGRSPSGPARASETARRDAMAPPTAVVAPPGQAAAAEPLAGEQLRLVSELQIESYSSSTLTATLLRVAEATRSQGNRKNEEWTDIESDLAEALFAQFEHGTLQLEARASLRSFLGQVLNCGTGRITDQFKKRVKKKQFQPRDGIDLDDVAQRLKPLVEAFIQSLQGPSRSKSPRPAIARAASPPPLPPAGVPQPPANAVQPVAAPAPAAAEEGNEMDVTE